MITTRSRAWIVLMGSMALAWSLLFSAGLTAPTGMATSGGRVTGPTSALIPGAQVSLPSTPAKAVRESKPRPGLSSLPMAAQPAVSATLAENDARYRVGTVGGALRSHNPAQALRADFTRQGIEV